MVAVLLSPLLFPAEFEDEASGEGDADVESLDLLDLSAGFSEELLHPTVNMSAAAQITAAVFQMNMRVIFLMNWYEQKRIRREARAI